MVIYHELFSNVYLYDAFVYFSCIASLFHGGGAAAAADTDCDCTSFGFIFLAFMAVQWEGGGGEGPVVDLLHSSSLETPQQRTIRSVHYWR